MKNYEPIKSDPLVTVLLPTYNRPQSLQAAIFSVLNQSYSRFELIIIRDGGEPVESIVRSNNDSRIHFINREENRGKAASLNEAVSLAKGEYICYLDDDDRWYPNHIQVLVEALQRYPEYGLAYSDLYKVHYRSQSGGRRQILAKNLEISRDFDRMLMLQFNHVLHVSLMHHRELLEKAGPYNEKLNVLIDWDLTRRLCFYTDFLHVPKVTGEYYASVDESDRISVKRRENISEYLRNLLTIRSTRPPKPWPCMYDLSVIVLNDCWDENLSKTLGDIWSHSYYPSQFYVPLPNTALSKIKTAVPNVVPVTVPDGASIEQKIDSALSVCQGDYVAIVPAEVTISNDEVSFLERSLNPMMQNPDSNTAYELVEATLDSWGAVFRKSQLIQARRQHPDLSLRQAVRASGINLRKPEYKDYPFQFDNLLTAAGQLQQNGEWLRAVKIYEYMQDQYANSLWMQTLQANALYHGGSIQKAAEIASNLNQTRSTPATLTIEARANRKQEKYAEAIELFRKAQELLSQQSKYNEPNLAETMIDKDQSILLDSCLIAGDA